MYVSVCVCACTHRNVWFANQQFFGACLSTPSLPPPPPPPGKQAGGGKQKRSHCEGEATGLFLLWEEMHTNVLPVRPPHRFSLLLRSPSLLSFSLSSLTHVTENQTLSLLYFHQSLYPGSLSSSVAWWRVNDYFRFFSFNCLYHIFLGDNIQSVKINTPKLRERIKNG